MASPPPAPHMRDPSPSRSDPTRGAPASGPGSSPGTSEAADEVTPLIQHPHLHSDDNPALHHHHQHQHLHPWSAAWGFAGPTTAAAAAAAAEAEAVGGNSRSSSSMSRGGATRRRRRSSNNNSNYDVESVVSSRLSADELALGDSAIGERLPYAAYTTIDWLHDLVKDTYRFRTLEAQKPGLRFGLVRAWEKYQAWIAAVLVGAVTAAVAYLVDHAESSLGDLKFGYCAGNWAYGRELCCWVGGGGEDDGVGDVVGETGTGTGTGMGMGMGMELLGWSGRTGRGWSLPGTLFGGGGALGLGMSTGADECKDWHPWFTSSWGSIGGGGEDGITSLLIYTLAAGLLALMAALVTKLTKTEVPGFASHEHEHEHEHEHHPETDHRGNGSEEREPPHRQHSHHVASPAPNKIHYMASGSGIPEIKLVLSGFEFPNLLSFRVLIVKAIGASLAVASGLCLGKEGPFVHISTSAGYIVSRLFPTYHSNGRKLREMLSVACSSALAVAFGSPVGGVLFVYEEMSSQFPRKVLWRAFLCSLVSAIVLKSLNPNMTGKLVLLETDFGVKYKPKNYIFFVLLGVAGGLFGAVFCKGSLWWNKKMKGVINRHPLLEVTGLAVVTALLQYPNPVTREPALLMIKSLLTDCAHGEKAWVCDMERSEESRDKWVYLAWLAYGSVVKIVLTILTTGAKIPSGLIVPALGAGAVFGRLAGQIVPDTSPGIFAMVGASAFLAGVSRMTVSLTVIMFELTGEVEYIPPFMIAILTAKLLVDTLHPDGPNDHTVLGEFLEHEHAARIARAVGGVAADLCPPPHHMQDMTLTVPGLPLAHGPSVSPMISSGGGDRGGGEEERGREGKAGGVATVVPITTLRPDVLRLKLNRMRKHGLRDAGLVLVDERGRLRGFIGEAELDFVVGEYASHLSHVHAEEGGAVQGPEHGGGYGSMEDRGRDGHTREHDPEQHASHSPPPPDGEGGIGDLVSGPLSNFIDRTPLSVGSEAPLEMVVEMFYQLGLRHLVVTDEGTARVAGVILKQKMILYLEGLRH